MYAIIETGGKQYRVQEGERLFVEKLPADAGETVVFGRVLAIGGDGQELVIGQPTVDGAQVTGKVLKQTRGKKIVIFKYKPKKNYRRKQGHRQPLTQVVIEKIAR